MKGSCMRDKIWRTAGVFCNMLLWILEATLTSTVDSILLSPLFAEHLTEWPCCLILSDKHLCSSDHFTEKWLELNTMSWNKCQRLTSEKFPYTKLLTAESSRDAALKDRLSISSLRVPLEPPSSWKWTPGLFSGSSVTRFSRSSTRRAGRLKELQIMKREIDSGSSASLPAWLSEHLNAVLHY